MVQVLFDGIHVWLPWVKATLAKRKSIPPHQFLLHTFHAKAVKIGK